MTPAEYGRSARGFVTVVLALSCLGLLVSDDWHEFVLATIAVLSLIVWLASFVIEDDDADAPPPFEDPQGGRWPT